MDKHASNIYRAPDSALETEPMSLKDLPRFSAWWVFFLAIVTLYIYPLYWLFNRSKLITAIFPDRPISEAFMFTIIILWIGSFGLDIVNLFYPIAYWNDLASSSSSLVINIGVIVWGFMIRSRLHDLFYSMGIGVRIGPILTFFFGPIYLSYKINEAKESVA